MHYIEVLVADQSYHGTGPLTYANDQSLPPGTIVRVPLRAKKVFGVVTGGTAQSPSFQAKPVEDIPALPVLPTQLIALLTWMKAYYPAPLGTIVQHFLPTGLPKKTIPPPTGSLPQTPPLPALTEDQIKAINAVKNTGTHILHGDTGTGKTRVYIELALQTMQKGRSVVVLTPEIGLTSQLVDTFEQTLPGRVILLHSKLTDATRKKIWHQIAHISEPAVVIGPRSALFSPLHNIGLIVVDESHETAYKQDKSPYYHTSVIAGKLGALHKAKVILGSATPLITDYYIALSKGAPIIRMTSSAVTTNENNTRITTVDIRNRENFGKHSSLSDALIDAVRSTLQKNEQVLLFLNRRGTARIILCKDCGWQALCPRCDLPLIYHGDTHIIRCHNCDFATKPPTTCYECNNTSLLFKTIGTKAVAEEVQRLFPEATIMRFDTDNKKDERIEENYAAIKDGKIDILIGTQTLAKGLDLPKLSLVGVIVADTSLYMPDFSAQERTFQLLSQVIGRVGRGHRHGQVIVQTYDPENPVLKAAITKNWQAFYQKELAEREQFLFPPFCFLLKTWCRRASALAAQEAAAQLADFLRSQGLKIIIEGPAPSFHEKADNKYQWQLIIKAKQRGELLKVIQLLPNGWVHDIDPMNLL